MPAPEPVPVPVPVPVPAAPAPAEAAAAPAPPPPSKKEPCVAGSLVYEDGDGGSLMLQLTKDEPIDGALAYFKSKDKVKMPQPQQLNKNGGMSDIAPGVGEGSAETFEGLCEFFRQAHRYGAHEVCFVGGGRVKPVGVFLGKSSFRGIKVSPQPRGALFDILASTHLAVVPEGADPYAGIASLSETMFANTAKKAGGASLNLITAPMPTATAGGLTSGVRRASTAAASKPKPKPKTTEELRAQLETIQAALVADPGNAQQTALKGEVVTALKARLEEVMAKLENDADNEEMLTLAADLEEVIENAEK